MYTLPKRITIFLNTFVSSYSILSTPRTLIDSIKYNMATNVDQQNCIEKTEFKSSQGYHRIRLTNFISILAGTY